MYWLLDVLLVDELSPGQIRTSVDPFGSFPWLAGSGPRSCHFLEPQLWGLCGLEVGVAGLSEEFGAHPGPKEASDDL